MSFSKEDSRWIRERTLRALSSNRTPGYHFAGYFLNFRNRSYAPGGVEFGVPAGPHCANADGIIHRAALLFSADMALAASNRAFLEPDVRTATLVLHVDFTGAPARGDMLAGARALGFSPRTALPESTCSGSLVCEGKEVMRMSGIWVSPPAPKGMVMQGLPWEGGQNGDSLAPLAESELDEAESQVMKRLTRALRRAPNRDLLSVLWDPTVRRTSTGASGRLEVGMHVGNRVGHVQGGLLINAALVTAEAAVPEHPITTAASAWYISPGQGKAVRARSTVLQSGRNIAVVRTEIFSESGKLALETISNHAAAAQA